MPAVEIPYGASSLRFEIPDANFGGVYGPKHVEAASDAGALVREALANPIGAPRLRDMGLSGRRVAIVVDDRTRPTPVAAILPVVVEELRTAGARDDDITVVLALGTHAHMTHEQIVEKLGAEMAARFDVVNPRYDDEDDLVPFGRSDSGVEIWINRTYAEAGFTVVIGSILPHGATGFSGGAKILYPGVAGRRTVEAFHEAANLDDRNRTGVVESPIRLEIEQFAARVGLDFIVNAVCAPEGGIYRLVAGHYVEAHRAGVEYARDIYGVELPNRAPVLIVGSYPSDLDFWQAGKAIFNAQGVVEDGGTLIVATPCPEGIPEEHAKFAEYIGMPSVELLGRIRNGTVEDRVTAAPSCCLARFRERIDIGVVSDGLSRGVVETMGFGRFESVQEAIAAALRRQGADALVSVIPAAAEVYAYVGAVG